MPAHPAERDEHTAANIRDNERGGQQTHSDPLQMRKRLVIYLRSRRRIPQRVLYVPHHEGVRCTHRELQLAGELICAGLIAIFISAHQPRKRGREERNHAQSRAISQPALEAERC